MSSGRSGPTRSGTSRSRRSRREPLVQGARRPEEGGQDQGPRRRRPSDAWSTAWRCNAAFLEAAKKDGLEVVFSKSYPLGAADLQPLIREAMATNPDAFIAFSYPPDTFMLTEQMQDRGLQPAGHVRGDRRRVPRPTRRKFGNKVNGILVYGGVDPSAPGMDEYAKAHQAMFNRAYEAGAVNVYAGPAGHAAGDRDGRRDRPQEDPRRDRAAARSRRCGARSSTSNQRNANPWAVGQWQNGEIVGVFPADKAGAKPLLFPKPQWS